MNVFVHQKCIINKLFITPNGCASDGGCNKNLNIYPKWYFYLHIYLRNQLSNLAFNSRLKNERFYKNLFYIIFKF